MKTVTQKTITIHNYDGTPKMSYTSQPDPFVSMRTIYSFTAGDKKYQTITTKDLEERDIYQAYHYLVEDSTILDILEAELDENTYHDARHQMTFGFRPLGEFN